MWAREAIMCIFLSSSKTGLFFVPTLFFLFFFTFNCLKVGKHRAFTQLSNVAEQQQVIWICINFCKEFSKEAVQMRLSFISVFIKSAYPSCSYRNLFSLHGKICRTPKSARCHLYQLIYQPLKLCKLRSEFQHQADCASCAKTSDPLRAVKLYF